MEMSKEIVLEVINKMIGEIDPVADSSIDSKRLENITLFIQVLDEMHAMIYNIPNRWKDTNYGSVFPITKACRDQLKKMNEEYEYLC